ncbi:MAG: hypothetical protein ACLFU8_08615 [Anaerolineales bacterium]
MLCNYLAWDKTVQTLDGVLSVASRPGYCANAACPGHEMRLLSAEGQQIALPGSGYGYDVIARIGWQRQERRASYPEIHADLGAHVQISESYVRHLYQQVYLPLLACQERQHQHRLEQAVQQHGGLIIALDGLAPEGGEPQLWFIRELFTGLTLRSGWLSQFDRATFETFLAPLSTALPGPVVAILSDKQRGLAPAVAAVFPQAHHHFCHGHYLKNLAEPWAESDSSFKVDLRKAVREAVGPLIRDEGATSATHSNVLCVTGVVPDAPSAAEVSVSSDTLAEDLEADVIAQLFRHTRYVLTLKGRPPFRLAGIETYQRLQRVADFTEQLLVHRQHPQLLQLKQGLQRALRPFAQRYQDLRQGATWLAGIAQILEPTPEAPQTGDQVACKLRVYLDDLQQLPTLSPDLETFRHHLERTSTSYWPGLFHCYDLEGLPRTNNDLESLFRNTQRRLLRTTGQKGQTRRALQRTGAWELLPRFSTESQCLETVRQTEVSQLRVEQQRLRQHLARFRLHTRSDGQTCAQFDRLRQLWLSLGKTSTG